MNKITVKVEFTLADDCDKNLPITKNDFKSMVLELLHNECDSEDFPNIDCEIISTEGVEFKPES